MCLHNALEERVHGRSSLGEFGSKAEAMAMAMAMATIVDRRLGSAHTLTMGSLCASDGCAVFAACRPRQTVVGASPKKKRRNSRNDG